MTVHRVKNDPIFYFFLVNAASNSQIFNNIFNFSILE